MDPIYVIRHSEEVSPGYLGDVLDAAGVGWVEIRLDRGETLPDPAEARGVVSLGGIMGAYDEDEYPFLAAEKGFLRKCVAAGVPVLGICLGCQMLADALGGRAYRAPRAEVAFGPITPTGDAIDDPIVGGFNGATLMWHQDTWEPPEGARVLAVSSEYPQAFRYGSAIGIQPHPEAAPEMARAWAESAFGSAQLEQLGIDRPQFLAEIAASEDRLAVQAKDIFGAWLEEVDAAANRRPRAGRPR